MALPKMVQVHQIIDSPEIDDYISAVKNQLNEAGLHEKVKPGDRIAITAGSRGVAHIREILATVVSELKGLGARPFIVPAMGSHGGASSSGQIRILKGLGVTEESMGAPIVSSMEVEEVGKLRNGMSIYVDRNALHSDGIVVVERVKPHTDFKDRIESGLMKMMVVGLGKHAGAQSFHSFRGEGYHRNLVPAAKMIIEKAPIVLGLAIVENAFHEIAVVKGVSPERFEEEEEELLKLSKKLLARIPFKEIDVLVVEEIGKNFSGVGMDTNVIGRFWIPGESASDTPSIDKIVALDLSEESYGNAVGVGLADIITRRLYDKIDFYITYINGLTTKWIEPIRIPVVLPNDREAIQTALAICGPIRPEDARLVKIRNTLELDTFEVSNALIDEVESNERLEVIGERHEMVFDALGMLIR